MLQATDTIEQLFKSDQNFKILKTALASVKAAPKTPPDLLGYLSPAHPYLIHVVETSENDYLRSLDNTETEKLINQLIRNHAQFIVFSAADEIPPAMLEQSAITLVVSENKCKTFDYLSRAISHIPIEETSIHGSFVSIFNQGILITGDSGVGKSTLLLELLDRNHLWIADDAPLVYRNPQNQIIAESNGHLAEYIHVQNIGAINVDQTYGKAKRIRRHPLAAIIHLSNNAAEQNSGETLIVAHKTIQILNQPIPKWCIDKDTKSRALLIETIARQLILNSWGDNASEDLTSAHNTVTSAQEIET